MTPRWYIDGYSTCSRCYVGGKGLILTSAAELLENCKREQWSSETYRAIGRDLWHYAVLKGWKPDVY